MPKLFISYRRKDSQHVTDRIYDHMLRYFGKGNVFQDVDEMPFGVDFREHLLTQINKADAMLVIIGADWARIMQERAASPTDFVRFEIETALAQDMIVVPVLVKHAQMPAPDTLPESIRDLVYLNAARVRPNPDFRDDCEVLANGILDSLRKEQPSVPDENLPHAGESRQNVWVGAFVGIFLLMAIGAGIALFGDDGSDSQVADLSTPSTEMIVATTPATSIPTATATPNPLELALERARAGVTSNAEWQAWYPEGFVREFDGVEMVLVPAGCFIMGSTDEQIEYAINELDAQREWLEDEQPAEEQCVEEPFWIDRYEVSQAQFATFGGQADDTNTFSGDELPRESITWYEARDFCELRGRDTTDDVRLPTEKEWEYAARGPSNLVYPWGNEWEGSLVNSNNDIGVDDYETTAPVTAFPAGASWVGAQQMSGNVWEWTSSHYEPYPYDATDGREAPDSDARRVLRGGSWLNANSSFRRAADRGRNNPSLRYFDAGFRCARLVT